MAITTELVAKATRRGAARNAAFPAVQTVRYVAASKRLVIELASGLELVFSPKHVQGLETARATDLLEYEISPSGLGIHFPKLDADVYLPALLSGFMGSKKWMAAEMGKLGGSKSSKAKVSAARENGKLGGRPRKLKPKAT